MSVGHIHDIPSAFQRISIYIYIQDVDKPRTGVCDYVNEMRRDGDETIIYVMKLNTWKITCLQYTIYEMRLRVSYFILVAQAGWERFLYYLVRTITFYSNK